MTTPARNSPSARLGPLAVGERERELRVAAAGRERQRKRAAEARIDVGDRQRAVRLAEALDRSPGPTIPTRLGDTARRARSAPRSWIVMPLIDSPPFDSIIVRGIAFRQRPVEVAEDVDRELLAAAARLHERVDGV